MGFLVVFFLLVSLVDGSCEFIYPQVFQLCYRSRVSDLYGNAAFLLFEVNNA